MQALFNDKISHYSSYHKQSRACDHHQQSDLVPRGRLCGFCLGIVEYDLFRIIRVVKEFDLGTRDMFYVADLLTAVNTDRFDLIIIFCFIDHNISRRDPFGRIFADPVHTDPVRAAPGGAGLAVFSFIGDSDLIAFHISGTKMLLLSLFLRRNDPAFRPFSIFTKVHRLRLLEPVHYQYRKPDTYQDETAHYHIHHNRFSCFTILFTAIIDSLSG